MPQNAPLVTPLPLSSDVVPNSLRAQIEARRANAELFSLQETIEVLVPLSTEAARRHSKGEPLWLHPSVVLFDGAAPVLGATPLKFRLPALPRDRSCLAPECRDGTPGNAPATVFSLAAIMYELLTGESVGPGMRRPTEISPHLPAQLETIMGHALVSDPSQRLDDLEAFATALHELMPNPSVRAPAFSHDRVDIDVAIDVSLSMMPPVDPLTGTSAASNGHPREAKAAPEGGRGRDATSRLMELKTRLESDPRARYVVAHQGMDHGPFTAVELLQQIANHAFVADSLLRDVLSQEARQINDWDEFAPFAEHAKLHREVKAEKQEMERVIVAEKKATVSKVVVGGGLIGIGLVGGLIWFLSIRGSRSDRVAIEGDSAVNVDVRGGVRSERASASSGTSVGHTGGYPVLPGGLSCEGAQAKYIDEIKLGDKGAHDLTAQQFGNVLGKGTYLNACSVPSTTKVSVCAAVQNGRAVGVTVTMNPRNPQLEGCVAGRIRGMPFPSNPKLDIARTNF